MTTRQSNIVFYLVISLIIYAVVLNYVNPEFFENFTKSKKELSIKDAINEGETGVALSLQQEILEERIKNDDEVTPETAVVYEEIAKLNASLGNKEEEKNSYLKSLDIKLKLKENDAYAFSNTYLKLGSLAEDAKDYDQAQMYFEKALQKRIGNPEDEDDGFFVGMQNTRQRYLRLNNENTIVLFKKLGNIHSLKQEKSIAKTYYEKALAVSKEIFGEEDSKTLEMTNVVNSYL